MNRGDLAVIVGGPWPESIGRVVRLVYPSKRYGSVVSVNNQLFWMTAPGAVWLVTPVRSGTLPGALCADASPKLQLRRRPYCECHLRPLLRKNVADCVSKDDEAVAQVLRATEDELVQPAQICHTKSACVA